MSARPKPPLRIPRGSVAPGRELTRGPLTPRQAEVLEFVRGYTDEFGYGPSYHEIARQLGVRSPATVAGHVQGLIEKGWLTRAVGGKARSLRVVDPGEVSAPPESEPFRIPAGARYVPVSALPGLFRAWLRRIGHSDEVADAYEAEARARMRRRVG